MGSAINAVIDAVPPFSVLSTSTAIRSLLCWGRVISVLTVDDGTKSLDGLFYSHLFFTTPLKLQNRLGVLKRLAFPLPFPISNRKSCWIPSECNSQFFLPARSRGFITPPPFVARSTFPRSKSVGRQSIYRRGCKVIENYRKTARIFPQRREKRVCKNTDRPRTALTVSLSVVRRRFWLHHFSDRVTKINSRSYVSMAAAAAVLFSLFSLSTRVFCQRGLRTDGRTDGRTRGSGPTGLGETEKSLRGSAVIG